MRIPAMAAVALALSACSGGETSTNEANALTDDNVVLMEEAPMEDSNIGMNGAAGPDSDASVNSATEELKLKDVTTNDPDTNLANGL